MNKNVFFPLPKKKKKKKTVLTKIKTDTLTNQHYQRFEIWNLKYMTVGNSPKDNLRSQKTHNQNRV